jgi:hypothetical protein
MHHLTAGRRCLPEILPPMRPKLFLAGPPVRVAFGRVELNGP